MKRERTLEWGVQQFSHSAGGQLLFPCTLGTIGWVTGRSFVI